MPKVNVYLSDELARAVRDAAIPISAVCQHALVQALQKASALRERPTAADDDVPRFLRLGLPSTPRLAAAFTTAAALAGAGGTVGTEHLACGVLAEGESLAVRVLGAMGIDVDVVRAEVAAAVESRGPKGSVNRLDVPATNVLRATQGEATRMGHDYVGCEHLVLALVGEPHGHGGRALRRAGAGPVATRRAMVAAMAGLLPGAEGEAMTPGGAEAATLDEVVERLDRLEALLTAR